MNQSNPEMEKQLDALADLCCQALQGEEPDINDRTEQLLKSLLMSGYARRDDSNLQVEVESRVKQACRDQAMHRGGALSAISGQMQKKFEELARWESKQPEQKSPPKAANISSSTDA